MTLDLLKSWFKSAGGCYKNSGEVSVTQTAGIPILTYHSIDAGGSVISTAPGDFRAQMKFLSEADFNVISLKTLNAHLRANDHLPPKTIVLTFDDGYQNFYTTAFPILNDYNFPATVFLIADHCGEYNDWSGNLPMIERSQLLSWGEVKELNNYKVEFGAHSLTHPDLTRIPPGEAEREIVGSKAAIEERLGVEAANFAYPYGAYNSSVRRIVQEHFKTACSTRLGKARPGDDLFLLKRVDAYYLRGEKKIRSITSANFDRYLSLRQTMRDLKAACYSKHNS